MAICYKFNYNLLELKIYFFVNPKLNNSRASVKPFHLIHTKGFIQVLFNLVLQTFVVSINTCFLAKLKLKVTEGLRVKLKKYFIKIINLFVVWWLKFYNWVTKDFLAHFSPQLSHFRPHNKKILYFKISIKQHLIRKYFVFFFVIGV